MLLASGCGGWEEQRVEEMRMLAGSRTSNTDGFAMVRIPVTGADQSLLLRGMPQDGYRSFVERVEDVDGGVLGSFDDAIKRSQKPTGAIYSETMTLFNWPISDASPSIAGEEIVVVLGTVDEGDQLNSNVKMDIEVLLKNDQDLMSGTLLVNLIYAGATSEDEALKAVVAEAMSVWEAIYAASDITLEFTEGEYAEGSLPAPGSGAPGDYHALSSSTAIRSVNVVLVPTVYESEEILGAAGGIPGSLLASSRSAVVVSVAANAGPDLEFDELETRLFGETMAHEVGHFLGLFHPVETEWDQWDALEDTEDCEGQQVCEDQLKSNIMFPYVVCNDGVCPAQDTLTEGQGSVLHRYTGMN